MRVHIVSGEGDLMPLCLIHWDASRMNKFDECDECLDDAHELEILGRGVNND